MEQSVKTKHRFIFILFSIILLVCCETKNSNIPASETQELKTFEFTAIVNRINGNPNFNVSIGDKLTGTFSYDLHTPNSYKNNNQQGNYAQHSPSNIAFQFNTINFRSDNSSLNKYFINIYKNDDSITPARDTFQLNANDLELAKELQMDDVSIGINLNDTTTKAFLDNSLPETINLNDFDIRNFSISATTKQSENVIAVAWWLTFTVTEIKSK